MLKRQNDTKSIISTQERLQSTHLSRMQETSKLSTSAGSMFSSLEMKVIAILVYGFISFTSTCVRMFLRRSAGEIVGINN